MSKPTRVTPCHPCFALFRGTRRSRPTAVEIVEEPVQIVEVYVGNRRELAVAMLGRATKFPLANFSGTWEVLGMDDGFAEFEAYWPAMPDLEGGVDIFAEQYGPPTGNEEPRL